ncbi:MAG: hypothetical protein ACE5IA_02960 [Dehalococcoidia bacterium]
MGLRTSTGTGTRVRHSTGLEWDELKKAKKKYEPLKHSTGEESKIRHSTGTEMDYRALRGEEEDGEEPEKRVEPGRLHSIPAKAGEDTTYLDLYAQSIVGKVKGQRGDTIVGAGGKPEEGTERATPAAAAEPEKKVSKEQFKAVSLDY